MLNKLFKGGVVDGACVLNKLFKGGVVDGAC